MTDHLSPAARAIVAAFNARHELCGPFDGNWPELCQAAALRAAADQLPLQPLTRDPADPFEQGLRQGQELSRAELLAIAAELEGADG